MPALGYNIDISIPIYCWFGTEQASDKAPCERREGVKQGCKAVLSTDRPDADW
jgi:hypothetical protein